MGQSIVFEALEVPVTSSVALVLLAVYLWLTHKRLGYAEVGFSYESVVNRGQWWRLAAAAVSHIELLHLGFNASALWSLRGAERVLGSGYYARTSLLLAAGSQALALLTYCLLVRTARGEQYRGVTTVGYSGVLFGWMAVIAIKNPGGMSRVPLLGLVHIPMALAPFGSLLLTTLLIPRASFVGHLAGIAVGYCLAYGALDWVTPVWALAAAAWLFVGVVYAAVRRCVSVPWVRLHEEDPADLERGTAGGGGALPPPPRIANAL